MFQLPLARTDRYRKGRRGHVSNGGTLSPGTGAPGALAVMGNLTLAPGAIYIDNLDPSSASVTNVSGSASLNGSLVANAAAGTYGLGQRYTLLTASGGVSGSFASFAVSGLSGAFRSALSYDANDVFLTLSPNALSPLLPAGATLNQRAVAGGIDAALSNGASLPGGFAALFGLSGPALGGALNQLTGEIGGDASQAAAQALTPFLALLMRTGNTSDDNDVAAATGAPSDVRPAQLQSGTVRVWGSAYGGHSQFGADAVTGAQKFSTGAVGVAIGIESQIDEDFLAGGSLALASETFSLTGGQSQGISSDVMVGVYMSEAVADHGYLSGALVYGSHNVGTERAVSVSGTDILKGKFVADDFGGRLEGGYDFGLGGNAALTPYAAFAGESFSSPAYNESALSGTSTFALSYAARDAGLVHSELGARLSHAFGLGSDMLSAELHAAWAHQIQDDAISRVELPEPGRVDLCGAGRCGACGFGAVGSGSADQVGKWHEWRGPDGKPVWRRLHGRLRFDKYRLFLVNCSLKGWKSRPLSRPAAAAADRSPLKMVRRTILSPLGRGSRLQSEAGMRSFPASRAPKGSRGAALAQSVEHRIRNAGVACSKSRRRHH